MNLQVCTICGALACTCSWKDPVITKSKKKKKTKKTKSDVYHVPHDLEEK